MQSASLAPLLSATVKRLSVCIILLLHFFDDFYKAPALGLREGTGLHEADSVADRALVILVVGVIFLCLVDKLTVDGMFLLPLHHYGDGLVAFVGGDNPDTFFS